MSNILNKIQLSGTTYDLVDSSAVHSLEGYATEQYVTAATNALAESIASQHYQTSGDVQNAISGKADSDDVYTKQQTDEKIAQASGATTGQVQTMIDQSISGKANSSDVITRLGTHYGEEGKAGIDVTKGGTTSTQYIITAGTGVNISSGNGISIDTDVVAQKSDIPAVSGYADSVMYNSSTHYVEFYHGTTAGTKVFEYDASPFLIDGMIESVAITSITSGGSEVEVLQITWNSAAGGQVTNIPLTDIFNPDNYYTKDEVDAELSAKTDNSAFTAFTASTDTALGNKADTTAMTQAISEATSGKADITAVTQAISEATSGKADSSTVEGINNVLTAHTANTTVHVTSSDKTTWNGKQDQLVSGTNIKTVGGNSLLGSGNIDFPAGLQVEVSGTTLVFG